MTGAIAMAVIPPKETEQMVATSMRLPKSLVMEIDQVAEAEGYSRNETAIHLFRFALATWHKERTTTGKQKK